MSLKNNHGWISFTTVAGCDTECNHHRGKSETRQKCELVNYIKVLNVIDVADILQYLLQNVFHDSCIMHGMMHAAPFMHACMGQSPLVAIGISLIARTHKLQYIKLNACMLNTPNLVVH